MARMFIKQMNHRVHLCSQEDVVEDNDTYKLVRKGVLSMWARVEPRSGSGFDDTGFAVNKDRGSRTHIIHVRYHRDFDVTNLAWVYEQRAKSGNRWFKVLSVIQTEDHGMQYWMMNVRPHERGGSTRSTDDDQGDMGTAMGLPNGVRL